MVSPRLGFWFLLLFEDRISILIEAYDSLAYVRKILIDRNDRLVSTTVEDHLALDAMSCVIGILVVTLDLLHG